jgi:predicted NBD/HSP70 family sugar kinase
LLDLARKRDEATVKVLKETGMRIGIGLAIFVNIFDPEVLAIGGGVSAVGDLPFDSAVYGLSGEIHPVATPQTPHCCRVLWLPSEREQR